MSGRGVEIFSGDPLIFEGAYGDRIPGWSTSGSVSDHLDERGLGDLLQLYQRAASGERVASTVSLRFGSATYSMFGLGDGRGVAFIDFEAGEIEKAPRQSSERFRTGLPGSTAWHLRQYESRIEGTLDAFDPGIPEETVHPDLPPLLIHMMTTMTVFDQTRFDLLKLRMDRAESLGIPAYPAFRIVGTESDPNLYFDRDYWTLRAASLARLCELRPRGEFRVGLDREAYDSRADIKLDPEGLAAVGKTKADVAEAMAPFLAVIKSRNVFPCSYPYEPEDAVFQLMFDAAEYGEAWTEKSFGATTLSAAQHRRAEYFETAAEWQRDRARCNELHPHVAYRCFLFDSAVRRWGRLMRANAGDTGPLPPSVFDYNRDGDDDERMWSHDWYIGINRDSRNDIDQHRQWQRSDDDITGDIATSSHRLSLYQFGAGATPSLKVGGKVLFREERATPESDSRSFYRVSNFHTQSDDWTIALTFDVDFPVPNLLEKKLFGPFVSGLGGGNGGHWYVVCFWNTLELRYDIALRHVDNGWQTVTIVTGYTPGEKLRCVIRRNGGAGQLAVDLIESDGTQHSSGWVASPNSYPAMHFGQLHVDGAGNIEPGELSLWFSLTRAARSWTDAEVAKERPDVFWPYGAR